VFGNARCYIAEKIEIKTVNSKQKRRKKREKDRHIDRERGERERIKRR
jgi:hypothetical protein